jgi:hypothetical protein
MFKINQINQFYEKLRNNAVIYYNTNISTDPNYTSLNQKYTRPSEGDALNHFITSWETDEYLTKIESHSINTIKLIKEQPKVTHEVVSQMMAECPKLHDKCFDSYVKLNFRTESSVANDLMVAKKINYTHSTESIITKKKLLLELANIFAQKLNIEHYAELMKIKIMAMHTDLITFFVYEPFIASILGILVYIQYHSVLYLNFDDLPFTNIVYFLDATMSRLYSFNTIDRINLYYQSFLIYCSSNPRKVAAIAAAVTVPVGVLTVSKYYPKILLPTDNSWINQNHPYWNVIKYLCDTIEKGSYSITHIIGSFSNGALKALVESKTELVKEIWTDILKKK